MEPFRVDLSGIDFSEGTGERVLTLSDGSVYDGDATDKFREVSHPFVFLFGV